MTFRIVPFEPWHLHEIEIQQPNLTLADWYGGDFAPLANGWSYTAIDDCIIGCAGIVPFWPGRDFAWSLLGDCGAKHFLRIHRAIARGLAERNTRRTEMWVDPEYPEAHRWAEMLGFEKETARPMKSFTPDGRDFDLYARIIAPAGAKADV